MFRFAQPDILYFLLLLPLLALGWWWSDRAAQGRLRQFAGLRLGAALTADNSRAKRALGRALWAGVYMCLIVGLARPQAGLARQGEESRGLDILFLVDTSRSMAAADEQPDRLSRVKRSLFYLLDRLEGNRMGLIQFAGVAFELCPLTQDTSALKLLIDSLDTTSLPVPGTNLGEAIQRALQAFGRNGTSGARNRAIVVMTDGENFGTLPYPAVKRAAEEGVHTYALGVGSREGAPVPSAADGTVSGPQDKTTRLDEKTLSKLALFGGGTYARLTSSGQEEDRLVEELNRLEKIELYTSRLLVWDDRYAWPAAAAALLLVFELLLGRRHGGFEWRALLRRVLRKGVAGGAMMLFLCLGAAAAPLRAETARDLVLQGVRAMAKKQMPDAERVLTLASKRRPQDPLIHYDLGCAYLKQYKYREAHQAFSRALIHAQKSLRQDAWYNLGFAAFYLGIREGQAERWYDSVEAFQQALLLDPKDEDARYNLEVVLREIRKRTQRAARRETQNQGGNQGNQSGSGADKPGRDRTRSEAKNNEQSPPREAQEKTKQRQKQGERTSTSEDQKGTRQKGMSQDDAMRTLRSLEADEQDLQKNRERFNPDQNNYRGPYW